MTTDAGGAVVVQDYDSTYGSFPLRSRLGYSVHTGAQDTRLGEVQSVVSETTFPDGDRFHTTCKHPRQRDILKLEFRALGLGSGLVGS